jgi:hypothetical protein
MVKSGKAKTQIVLGFEEGFEQKSATDKFEQNVNVGVGRGKSSNPSGVAKAVQP